MRRLVWLAALAGLTQVTPADAQPGTYNTDLQPPSASAGKSSENCGTPDQFKSCPPLPRRNLETYQGDRPHRGARVRN